jgi:hypothetical protein
MAARIVLPAAEGRQEPPLPMPAQAARPPTPTGPDQGQDGGPPSGAEVDAEAELPAGPQALDPTPAEPAEARPEGAINPSGANPSGPNPASPGPAAPAQGADPAAAQPGRGAAPPLPPGLDQLVPGPALLARGPVELILNPEEMGRLRFEMSLQGDSVTIHVSADRAETLDLLRRHGDQLVEEMKAAGFLSANLDFSGRAGKDSRPAPPLPLAPASAPEPAFAAHDHPRPPRATGTSGLDLRL